MFLSYHHIPTHLGVSSLYHPVRVVSSPAVALPELGTFFLSNMADGKDCKSQTPPLSLVFLILCMLGSVKGEGNEDGDGIGEHCVHLPP